MTAPKKIWVWDYAADQMVNENPDSTDVQYIRADLVDELVEALEHTAQLLEALGGTAFMARDVLKAMEEEE